ncbi:MAG TPA: tetratricopeptide repeat protein [Kofleriaceae bacterium]|nr:tetratricopeptide repeat protein [Kofleriaceae bacterium]
MTTTDLERALARAAESPSDVDARIAAAYACDRAGREDEAVRHYDAAWALGVPAAARRRFVVGYGSTLRNVGRLEEAVAILGDAVAAEPDYAPYKVFLGLALHSSGQHAAATATLLAAVLDLHGGARLDGFERAIGEYQEELLARAVAARS